MTAGPPGARSTVGSQAGAVVVTAMGSGVPLITGILTWIVTLGFALTAPTDEFAPGLADPLNYLLTATAFIGPMSAGAAALQAGRVVRSGVADLAGSTSRGQPGALLVAGLAIAGWQLSAVACADIILLVRSDLSGARSAAMLLLILLAIAVVAVSVMIGVVVGSRRTGLLVPPATAVAVFAWVYGWSFATGKWQRLSPVYPDVFYQVWFQPHTLLVVSQSLVLVGLCVLLVSWTASAHPTFAAGVGAIVLLAGAVAWVVSGPDAVQYRSPPQHIPCRSDGLVSLCYWPESADTAQAGVQTLALIHQRLRGYLRTPTRYAQTGLRPRYPDRRIYQLPMRGDGDFFFRAVLASVPQSTCQTRRSLDIDYALQSFIQALVTDQPAPTRRMRALQKGPKTVAHAWIRSRLDDLATCR